MYNSVVVMMMVVMVAFGGEQQHAMQGSCKVSLLWATPTLYTEGRANSCYSSHRVPMYIVVTLAFSSGENSIFMQLMKRI